MGMMRGDIKSVAIIYDSFKIEGSSFEEIIFKMSKLDWWIPTSNLEFKRNVGQRLLVLGKQIVFWDARSFIYALFGAEIIDAIFEEYHEEQEVKLERGEK